MKIGILTFHIAHNYGAVLQALALQKKFEIMGHEVLIIDYRPPYLIDPYKIFSLSHFKHLGYFGKLNYLMTSLFRLKVKKNRFKAFDEFIRNNLNLSTASFSAVSDFITSEKIDLYVIGSDQVWNYRISRGMDLMYWGNFDASVPKVSYAASMGKVMIGINEFKQIEKNISNFKHVGVRELDLKLALRPLSNTSIDLTLDPTLLLSKSNWSEISIAPEKKDKYVFLYQLRGRGLEKIAEKIAKKIGGYVLEISGQVDLSFSKNKIDDASPNKFLGYIENAEYIVTSSFHGTVFSIIFEKNFYYVSLNDGHDNRSISLLEQLDLGERGIDRHSEPELADIDYYQVRNKLKSTRSVSEDYLNKILCIN